MRRKGRYSSLPPSFAKNHHHRLVSHTLSLNVTSPSNWIEENTWRITSDLQPSLDGSDRTRRQIHYTELSPLPLADLQGTCFRVKIGNFKSHCLTSTDARASKNRNQRRIA